MFKKVFVKYAFANILSNVWINLKFMQKKQKSIEILQWRQNGNKAIIQIYY